MLHQAASCELHSTASHRKTSASGGHVTFDRSPKPSLHMCFLWLGVMRSASRLPLKCVTPFQNNSIQQWSSHQCWPEGQQLNLCQICFHKHIICTFGSWKKTSCVKLYRALAARINTAPGSSSPRTIKSALTTKSIVKRGSRHPFLLTTPELMSHVVTGEQGCSHARYFSRPLPCLLSLCWHFICFYF